MPHTVIVQGDSPQTVTLGTNVVEFLDVGVQGPPGSNGVGVPPGGTATQVLAKASATNYDTEWVDAAGGALTNGYATVTGNTGTATAVGEDTINVKGNTDGSIVTVAAQNTPDTLDIQVDIVDAGYY